MPTGFLLLHVKWDTVSYSHFNFTKALTIKGGEIYIKLPHSLCLVLVALVLILHSTRNPLWELERKLAASSTLFHISSPSEKQFGSAHKSPTPTCAYL